MHNLIFYLLALFAIAAFTRADFFFTIVYLFSIVYLLSRLWTQRATRHLRIQRHFTDHAFCGEWTTVDVVLHNTDWLPIPWLEIHESLPTELTAPAIHQEVISLGAHERRRFQYTLNCRKRGYYTIGPLMARTGDLLGMMRISQTEVTPEHIVVYPRIVPLEELTLPTHSPQVALPARAPLFEDPARVIGVRDYRRGDSPRRIHWTATASASRLLVKQYQPAIARETLICIDLDSESYGQRWRYTATELAIVIAASVANHIAVQENLPVGLATDAWDPLLEGRVRFSLPPRRERAHLMNLLEVLARVQMTPATPFTKWLRQESADLSWGATISIITGRADESLLDTLAYLRRAGFTVALILVRPHVPTANLKARADLLSVPVHHVWTERNLGTWQL